VTGDDRRRRAGDVPGPLRPPAREGRVGRHEPRGAAARPGGHLGAADGGRPRAPDLG
jgi:hypothetical protein